jgi:signal transduction histidine kinase
VRAPSLLGRAALAAVLSVAVALLVAGSVVDLLVARHLRESLDTSLRQRAIAVAQLSASAPALLTAPGALDASIGGTQVAVEVLDARGRIVARSLSLGSRLLPVSSPVHTAIADGRAHYATVHGDDGQLRLYAAPLARVGGSAAGGAVVVAAPTSDLRATVRSLRLFTVLAALTAALVGGAAVVILTRRALRPLGRLAAAAGAIERSGDARERLPVPAAADDEVARLARTLNGMLGSLERAHEAERRFLADASHELRTPLTALRGNVDFLARHGATPELVADLSADASRLSRLADDLLALSREEAPGQTLEPVRLDEIAREAAHGTDAQVDAPAPVEVRGDRDALVRAVANLIDNAQLHGEGAVLVTVDAVNGAATVAVTDEGAGIAPEDVPRAFDRFWRGASSASGSGLGLAIVRATAERHGGRATVDGARVAIELPALTSISESGATTPGGDRPKGQP